MNKFKIFFINGIILTLTNLGLQTVGMYFNVYVTNKIGSEAIGLFTLVMSVYSFFLTLATSGIFLSSTRLVSEELSLGTPASAKKAIKTCIFYSFSIGFVASIILYLTSPFIVKYILHDKITTLPFHVISISLPFIAISSSISGYFSAVRKAYKSASAQIFEQLLRIVIITYLLSLFLPNRNILCSSSVSGSAAQFPKFFHSYTHIYYTYLIHIS